MSASVVGLAHKEALYQVCSIFIFTQVEAKRPTRPDN